MSTVIISFLLLIVTWYVLWRTSFGLRLRSCGEDRGAHAVKTSEGLASARPDVLAGVRPDDLGAVAIMAIADARLGQMALRLLELGYKAPAVVEELVRADPYAEYRQLGVIDAVTKGGPGDATTIMVYKLYKDGFIGLNLGSSGAQSVILMAILLWRAARHGYSPLGALSKRADIRSVSNSASTRSLPVLFWTASRRNSCDDMIQIVSGPPAPSRRS